MDYDFSENPAEIIERQAEEVGVPVSQILKEAGVHRNTLNRWKRCACQPTWNKWHRVQIIIKDYWSRQYGSRNKVI